MTSSYQEQPGPIEASPLFVEGPPHQPSARGEEPEQRPPMTSEQTLITFSPPRFAAIAGSPWRDKLAPLRSLKMPPREEPEQRPPITSEQRDDEAWINGVIRRKVKDSHPKFHPTNQHTIFRAPENIGQSNRAAYDPSVVCIGPLCFVHGDIPSGCVKLDDCKWRFLRCLLSRCGNRNDARRKLDECFMELKSRDAEVRSCYSEDLSRIGTRDLATGMLLDGSFIIYLLLRRQEEGDVCSIVTSPDRLETLGGSTKQGTPNLTGEEEVSNAGKVNKVQESTTKVQEKGKEKVMGASEPDLESGSGLETGLGFESESVDLEIGGIENIDGSFLGNLWTWNLIVYDLLKLENQIPFFVIRLIYDKLFKTPSNGPKNVEQLTDLALNLFSDIHPNKSIQFRTMPPNEIHHLLHLFHSSIVTYRQVTQPVAPAARHETSTTPEWIPNATELAMAGVKFRRKKKFNSFLDVSFENGVLEIPLLRIYDYTNFLFRNLIAFEQCYPNTNTDITLYANFMDCIVNTANDVKLLNMKGILINRLSTDDEVASLFNQLCNQVHYDPKKNYLKNLFVEVTKYHESKWHQWRASLVRDYFYNPWVTISVLAAVLLLLLTIDQSFFATFSYFRPPNPSAPPPNS